MHFKYIESLSFLALHSEKTVLCQLYEVEYRFYFFTFLWLTVYSNNDSFSTDFITKVVSEEDIVCGVRKNSRQD